MTRVFTRLRDFGVNFIMENVKYKKVKCPDCSGDGTFPPDGQRGIRLCMRCQNGIVFVPVQPGEKIDEPYSRRSRFGGIEYIKD